MPSAEVGRSPRRANPRPERRRRNEHLAGAGVTSQQALVDEIARQAGRTVKLRTAGKWTLRMLGIFNPLMREMVEMHYLLTEPVLLDDSALQELIGPIHKTPYPEGVRQTLAAMRASTAADR